MAVLSNTGIRGGASIVTDTADPYRVKRSARFNDDNSAYLNRTFATADSKKIWTISLWFKRSSGFGGEQGIFNSGVSGHPSTFLKIDTSNRLEYGDYQSGYICQIVTNRVFRDPSAWYHLTIAVDTTQGTEANRFKLYINGVQETSFSSANYYSQNDDTDWNNAEAHTLATKSTDEFNGYLADIYFIDGTAKAATDFAETDSTTGQWVPKEYDGTYGTNGFHLAMDPANGGTMYSKDLTNDVGGAFNPHNAFDGGISSECHSWSSNGDTVLKFEPSTAIAYSSKVEIYLDRQNYAQINGGGYTQYAADAWHTLASGSGTLTTIETKYGSNSGGHASLSAVRVDDKILADHSAIGYDSSGNNNHWHENNLFGTEHATANENFKAVKYKGNGTASTALNCGFAPDFVWIKRMNSSGNHTLWPKQIHPNRLHSDGNWAEGDGTTALSAFTSTGVTLGSHIDTNNNGDDYIAWFWKGGGTPSTLDAGTIDASVSANTSHGFSVMTYTGTGPSSSGTVAHGLGKKPDMIIAKKRNAATNWYVWHSSSASNINTKYALLNTTDKVNQAAGNLFATVGTTTFGVEAGSNTNNDGNMLALCFAEIEGYSKFGHYLGSGSSTGPVVECGFAPAFVLLRRVDDDNNWQIFDNARDTNKDLKPNTDEVEGSANMDFLPNGFQPRNTYSSVNASSAEYIYMAIAGPPEGDLDLLADTPGAPYDNSLNGGGNYATLDPNESGSGVDLSDGNLKAYIASSNHCAKGNFGMSSGKWYWEINITQDGNNTHGIAPTDFGKDNWCGVGESLAYNGNNGQKYTNSNGSAYGATHGDGDIIGTAFNADSGSLTFYKNGVSQGVAFSGIDMTKTWVVCCGQGASTHTYNFGQRAFAYTPPTDHKALNTYNITDPTVVKGNTGFGIKLYDGNSGTQTISGLEFSPDLVWLKQRNATASHYWYDTVRGTQKLISCNYEGLENWAGGGGTAGELTAFTSDGFTIVNSGSYGGNVSGGNFIVWNWDAGSAGSNTAISAGGLNSALYDQSQTWSNAVTGTLYSGQAATTLFNNTDSGIHAATNNTLTFTTPGGVTLSGTVEVHMSRGTGASSASGDYDVKINGTSVFDHSTMPYNTNGWVNLGSHTLSTLAWGYNTGNDWIQMNRIKVGGKELIDSGVSVDTIPSIASEYRVNTETGFSIVSYTGDGGNPPTTVAHGLNAKPDFIICKNLIDGDDWVVYHSTLGAEKVLELNQYTAAADETNPWYDTEPTSTVFTVGGESRNNGPSDGIIAYCWSGVSGYSKFGSYEGNNDSNGPFVWCGFRPKWILIKGDIAGEDWCIVDSVKEANDGSTIIQFVNENATEYESGVYDLDILSNGFKLRNTNPRFNTGNTYLFAAFADSPFKYANAF